jgi:hypothetical protein
LSPILFSPPPEKKETEKVSHKKTKKQQVSNYQRDVKKHLNKKHKSFQRKNKTKQKLIKNN